MNDSKEKQLNQPVYPIGIASDLVGVCQATLRIWEKKGLISPARLGKNRYYSETDIARLRYVKHLLRDKGLNLAGAKDIIETHFCWDIKECEDHVREACPVYRKYMYWLESETPDSSANTPEADAELQHD